MKNSVSINIPKSALIQFVKSFLIVGLALSIIDRLLGFIIYFTFVGALIWPLVCLGILWVTSFRPFVISLRDAQGIVSDSEKLFNIVDA